MAVPQFKQVFSEGLGWLTLTRLLGVGGEAEVHAGLARRPGPLPPRELAVALYDDEAMPPDLAFLLDCVERATGRVRGLVRTHGPVLSQPNGHVVGYAMDLVRGRLLCQAKFRTVGGRLRFALGMARVVRALLDRGLVWSDCKPDNVFVGIDGLPVLIDKLSLSFLQPLAWPDGTAAPRHFPKGMLEWTEPENLGKQPEEVERSAPTAAYSLALIVHQALKDAHPAAVTNLDGVPLDLEGEVQAGGFGRYAKLLSRRIPVDRGIPHRRLPAEVRYLFDLAFRVGRAIPEQRPTVGEWVEALERWQSRRRRVTAAAGLLAAAGAVGLANRFPDHLPPPPWGWLPSFNRAAEHGPAPRGRPAFWNALQQER